MHRFSSLCLLLTLVSLSVAAQDAPARRQKTAPPAAKNSTRLSSPTDPVCQMPVASTVADTAHYAGKHYGFCSKSCKSRFKQNPTAYVKKP